MCGLQVMVLLMRYALGDLHKMKTFVASYLDASVRMPSRSDNAKCTYGSHSA